MVPTQRVAAYADALRENWETGRYRDRRAARFFTLAANGICSGVTAGRNLRVLKTFSIIM